MSSRMWPPRGLARPDEVSAGLLGPILGARDLLIVSRVTAGDSSRHHAQRGASSSRRYDLSQACALDTLAVR